MQTAISAQPLAGRRRERVRVALTALTVPVVVLLLALPATASAAEYGVHALPEVGRCLKVAKGTHGEYKGIHCVSVATGSKGRAVWEPVSSAATFKMTATSVVLATPGHPTVSCPNATLTGEWTGPKSASGEFEFTGCTDSEGEKCESSPLEESVIKSSALEAALGVIRKHKNKVLVGLDLKAASGSMFTYECSLLNLVKVEGSVIGQVTPADKMVMNMGLGLKTVGSAQEFEGFEGEPKDTLTSSFKAGAETAPSTLAMTTVALVNASNLEVKVKQSTPR